MRHCGDPWPELSWTSSRKGFSSSVDWLSSCGARRKSPACACPSALMTWLNTARPTSKMITWFVASPNPVKTLSRKRVDATFYSCSSGLWCREWWGREVCQCNSGRPDDGMQWLDWCPCTREVHVFVVPEWPHFMSKRGVRVDWIISVMVECVSWLKKIKEFFFFSNQICEIIMKVLYSETYKSQ